MTEPAKLYVVVRRDLPPGLQAAQAGHAIAELCIRHPQAAFRWNRGGNYLIVLAANNERDLIDWYLTAKSYDMTRELWREPDLQLDATAFAAFPEPEDNEVFARLPLALQEKPRRRWVPWHG